MHYRYLGRAASIDAEFSGRKVKKDENGYPIEPISIDLEGTYEKALKTKDPADIAIFLKSWRTRTKVSSAKIRKHIKNKRRELKALENLDIMSVDLDNIKIKIGRQTRSLQSVIVELFVTFSDISVETGRKDYTAASKILHVLLPKFFIMWDNCIRCAYGCKIQNIKDAGEKYFRFMKRVQKEGMEAVESYCKERCYKRKDVAIQRIENELYQNGFYSFARLLDIYNFQKYTIGDDRRLWA